MPDMFRPTAQAMNFFRKKTAFLTDLDTKTKTGKTKKAHTSLSVGKIKGSREMAEASKRGAFSGDGL